MLFTMRHCIALQWFGRHDAVRLPRQEHTTGSECCSDLLGMILFPGAGSASLLDQGNPLFVGHVVDMP
jgi:hypothetical protein